MKKILFAFAAVALLFATSCKKESINPAVDVPEGSFLATIDNGANPQNAPRINNGMGTMTTIDVNRYVIWETGDKISINGSIYTTTSNPGSTVVFSGGTASGSKYHAFYPASIAGEGAAGVLPDTQRIETGKVSNLPMYANSESNQLTFYNICAALKVKVPGSADGATSIAVLAKERLCGNFTIEYDEATPYADMTNAAASDSVITVVKDQSATFATGDSAFIAIPQGTYTNFTIQFKDANDQVLFAKVIDNITVAVNKVYNVNLGNDIPAADCFHFTACANNNTIGMTNFTGKDATSLTASLEYCTYTSSTGAYSKWKTFAIDTTKVVLSNGDKVYFRAGASGNTAFGSYVSVNNQWYDYFTASDSVTVGGNIMYLLNANGQTAFNTNNTHAFYFLFLRMKTLTSAEDLELPATILSEGCYRSLFSSCENLRKAPKKLPATALKERCYMSMFYYTKIDTAPEMTVNSVMISSCNSMFSDCKYMTDASKINLAATTLAESCYQSMFTRDSLLTSGPELNAATLVKSCYGLMFKQCVRLSSVTMKATNVSASNCLNAWLKDGAGTLVPTETTPTLTVHSTTTTSSAWYNTISTNTPTNWAIKAEGATSNLRNAQ